jgi:hypothetical protein
MIAIHSQARQSDWRRVASPPPRVGRLVKRALAIVRDWRRGRRNHNARISRDVEICRGDPLDLDREQKQRGAWPETLDFPPFEPCAFQIITNPRRLGDLGMRRLRSTTRQGLERQGSNCAAHSASESRG